MTVDEIQDAAKADIVILYPYDPHCSALFFPQLLRECC